MARESMTERIIGLLDARTRARDADPVAFDAVGVELAELRKREPTAWGAAMGWIQAGATRPRRPAQRPRVR